MTDLRKEHLFTVQIGGHEFVLRRLGALQLLRLRGSGALGHLRSVSVKPGEELSEQQAADLVAAMDSYLRMCMVNPRLGDETDIEATPPVYTLDDLGDYAIELFTRLTGRADEDAQDFERSSVAVIGTS